MDIYKICVYFLFPSRHSVKIIPSVKGKPMTTRKSGGEVTSKKAATAASAVLRDPKSSAAAKSAAASALTQRPSK